MNSLLWRVTLLLGIAAVAAIAARAATRDRSIWLPVTAVWLGLALALYLATRPNQTLESALDALALLLPVAVTALVARAEAQRGRTLWRAGSIAFVLGACVAAVAPLLVVYLGMTIAVAVTGDGP